MATPTVRTNFAAVARAIGRVCRALDLDGPGSGRAATFGDALMDLAYKRILARSKRRQAPGGAKWDPNKGKYGEWKRRIGKPVGELTGEMLSEEQVRGRRRVVGPDSAWMRYGRTVSAYRKAGFFHKGTNKQVARPFFDVDAEDRAALTDLVRRQLDRAIRREG